MKNKRIILAAVVLAAVAFFAFRAKTSKGPAETIREVTVTRGAIEKSITATAIVQPQNRLEMKPPVSGRVEKILVQEGDKVQAGQVVALMSSSERAALLDAAKSKGEKETAYWEEIYKPVSLIAPIDGTVIVSIMQPGQSVTQTDAVIVLSDRLIVQAQIDETDIGSVQEGQKAVVTLDAYPETEVNAAVDHIFHESTVVNNVTIYKVNLLPETTPDLFRSGMSAAVRLIEQSRPDALLVPVEAVKRSKDGQQVLRRPGKGKKPVERPVETGLSDGTNVEIVSGLEEGDLLVIKSRAYKASGTRGTNPLAPQANRRRDSSSGNRAAAGAR